MKRLFVIVLLSFLASLLFFLAATGGAFYLGYRRSAAGWGRERLRDVEEGLLDALAETLPLFEGEERSPEAAALLEENVAEAVPPGLLVAVYDSQKRPLLIIAPPPHMRGMSMMHRSRGPGAGGWMGRGPGEAPIGRPGGRPGGYPGEEPGFGVEREMDAARLPLKPVSRHGVTLGYYRIGVPSFGSDRANARFLGSMRRTLAVSVPFSFVLAFLVAFLLSRRLGRSAKRVSDGIERIAAGNLSLKIPEDGAEEIVLIARAANELAGKLEREAAMRRQWAADVAHDLRTPVAAVRAQLEGMRDGVLDLTRERAARNLEELLRIEALVNDLGELTRLESPEMRIDPVPVGAEGLCRDLKTRFESAIEGKGIAVEWAPGGLTLVADGKLLLRALTNLLSNAVRHTPRGGRIGVSFGETERHHSIRVFNTGDPIPEGEIELIFQRLYRGERARQTPGTGLGLTIALRIAELHGGTVSIESGEGRGTTVTMTLAKRDAGAARPG